MHLLLFSCREPETDEMSIDDIDAVISQACDLGAKKDHSAWRR